MHIYCFLILWERHLLSDRSMWCDVQSDRSGQQVKKRKEEERQEKRNGRNKTINSWVEELKSSPSLSCCRIFSPPGWYRVLSPDLAVIPASPLSRKTKKLNIDCRSGTTGPNYATRFSLSFSLLRFLNALCPLQQKRRRIASLLLALYIYNPALWVK